MSRKLKNVEAEEKAIAKAIAASKAQLKLAEKKNRQVLREWPWQLRCKKCGLAFKANEIGYKEYEVRKNDMRCQYGGDYDIRQITERQFIGCCPECGKLFGIEVMPSEYVDSTSTYSRWDEKPEFRPTYSKCADRTIRKVSPYMAKFVRKLVN